MRYFRFVLWGAAGSRTSAGHSRFAVLCALLAAAALCALGAVQPPSASAKASKYGVMSFKVTYKLADEAEWSFDIQEECGRSVGRGRQQISGNVSTLGMLDVARVGSRLVPDPENGRGKVWNDLGAFYDSSGPATYELYSDREDSSNAGPNCPEPIICSECTSNPPVKSCGSRNGTVKLRPDISYVRSTAYIRLEDQWEDPDPFTDSNANTYCPESMAVWRWGSGFPATNNPENDQVIKLDTRRLMGFNRLTDRQKASCGKIGKEGRSRFVEYARDLCGNGKQEPSWIKKADYTRSIKTILLRNDEPPKRWEVQQTSRLTIEYEFRVLTLPLGK